MFLLSTLSFLARSHQDLELSCQTTSPHSGSAKTAMLSVKKLFLTLSLMEATAHPSSSEHISKEEEESHLLHLYNTVSLAVFKYCNCSSFSKTKNCCLLATHFTIWNGPLQTNFDGYQTLQPLINTNCSTRTCLTQVVSAAISCTTRPIMHKTGSMV